MRDPESVSRARENFRPRTPMRVAELASSAEYQAWLREHLREGTYWYLGSDRGLLTLLFRVHSWPSPDRFHIEHSLPDGEIVRSNLAIPVSSFTIDDASSWYEEATEADWLCAILER